MEWFIGYVIYTVLLLSATLRFVYVISAYKGEGRKLTKKDVVYSTFFCTVPIVQIFWLFFLIKEILNSSHIDEYLKTTVYKERI